MKIVTGNIKTNCQVENSFEQFFYLPQNPYYPKDITLFDYLSLVFFKNNWKWFLNTEEKQKISKVLNQTDLYDKKDLYLENLSGGEIQRANIAMGLLTENKLFILDEPSSNMDLINKIKSLEMLKKLTEQNITCVVIMHDLNLVLNYGDYFIGLGYNNSIISEKKDKFFTPEILKKLYGIDFEIINNSGKMYVQIAD